jgi:hypothetical protein
LALNLSVLETLILDYVSNSHISLRINGDAAVITVPVVFVVDVMMTMLSLLFLLLPRYARMMIVTNINSDIKYHPPQTTTTRPSGARLMVIMMEI